jgi:uncharacterized protein YndB with AHSA1/START domain
MFFVANRIEFAHPPEAVLDYISTPDNWPTWHPASRRVEGTTDRPLRKGDQVVEYFEAMGFNLVYQWTVHDRIEGRKIWLHGRPMVEGVPHGPLNSIISYSLFPTAAGGTDFVREIEVEETPALASVWDQERFHAQQETALANIKHALDAGR